MKGVERIFEHRIRHQIEIDDMQFGFMKGKGTTDAIFMARQMQENFKVKGKKLYFGFVDLEKAFHRAMLCIRGSSHGPVSVCPSQAGVLLKRQNVRSQKQHHTIPQGL